MLGASFGVCCVCTKSRPVRAGCRGAAKELVSNRGRWLQSAPSGHTRTKVGVAKPPVYHARLRSRITIAGLPDLSLSHHVPRGCMTLRLPGHPSRPVVTCWLAPGSPPTQPLEIATMSEPNLLVILALPARPGGRLVQVAARPGRRLPSVVTVLRPARGGACSSVRGVFIFPS